MAGTYQDKLGSTTFIIPRDRLPIPCSVALSSADATRKIELSFDNGGEYITPVYDYNTATMLVVALLAPALVRLTGLATDTVTVTSDTKRVP